MAAIDTLLEQIADASLRERLREEINRLTQNKKFGLVFEEHMPECTPLYGVPVKRGGTVAKKANKITETYTVIKVNKDMALCRSKVSGETEEIARDELVTVSEFGEAIFPCLTPIDRVENAPDSDLWHTLIEADNYHALQLLEYLYSGKVDCIYIDPPYNTGTDEWKYNDAFVDASDHWSHSKWLSFMKKRLCLAQKLLSENGKLIISIGYQELHRLCLLCEELFPNKQVVPVTVQTSGGKPSGGFNYLQEYLVFIVPLDFVGNPTCFSGGRKNSPYHGMTLASFSQEQRPNQVYPIFVERATGKVIGVGKSLAQMLKDGSYCGNPSEFEYKTDDTPVGAVAVWPISNKGNRCVWRLIPSRFLNDLKKGYIRTVRQTSKEGHIEFSVQFLSEGIIKKISSGEIISKGRDAINNTYILDKIESDGTNIPTIWTEKEFYTAKGTSQIQSIFGSKEFPYPKPLALITEVLHACTGESSIVLDFFAGSGTTLNAVNLLNEQDGGSRVCIMVTNNELSKKQVKAFEKAGVNPGDELWNEQGICRAVTWPRTVYTITGKGKDGQPLNGKYDFYNDEEHLMADGFKANCEYFKLDFLDRNRVSLGTQFCEILPLLWLKSGAVGKRPEVAAEPQMLVLPKNRFAVLVDEAAFAEFAKQVAECDSIDTVYFVTNSEAAFHEMSANIGVKNTHQLYREYIDNFVIGARRDTK